MSNKFYKEIRHIILLFQLFSIAPFAQTANQTLLMQLHSFTAVLILLTICTTAVFITGLVRQNSLQAIVGVLIFVAEIIAHAVIIIQSYTTRHQQLKIIENINAIDEHFQRKLSKTVEYDGQLKRYYIKVFGMFGVMLATLFAIILLMLLRNDEYLLTFLLQICYSMIVIRVRCIQIIFYVDVLNDRIKMVNNAFGILIKRESERLKVISTFNQNFEVHQQKTTDLDYVELQALKKIYCRIWDNICLINDCFGWSILAICTQYFIHLTTHGYWLFLALANQLPQYQIVQSSIDIVTVLFIMWMLCSACYNSTQSVSSLHLIFWSVICSINL